MSAITTAAVNLPALVTRQGGALTKVLSEVDAYVTEGYTLNRQQMVSIGRLVSANPDLNNEQSLAVIVDLFTYHGLSVCAEFLEAQALYGLEDVALATELMFELGQRTVGTADHVVDWSDLSRQLNPKRVPVNHRVSGHDQDDTRYDANQVSWYGRIGVNAICELIACLREEGVSVDDVDQLADHVYHLGGLVEACGLSHDSERLRAELRGDREEDLFEDFQVDVDA